jgi:FixJ family two-component response regulator
MRDNSIVYIVDDDPSVRRALARRLQAEDIMTACFATAAEFLERARSSEIACVVLDVRLPDADGLELQTAMAERGDATPIVFITGHGDIPMGVEAMKAGAVDFLPKPFDDDEFVSAVRTALDRAHRNAGQRAELEELRARYETLTAREREVMTHVVRGQANKRTAMLLGTTEKTVKVHRARVMEKMAADSLAELVRMAGKLESVPALPDSSS